MTMRLLVLFAMLLSCAAVYADIVTLTTGFVIEGRVVDAEADPVYVEIPKGKIAVYKDMIESIAIGDVVGEEEGEPSPPPIAWPAPSPARLMKLPNPCRPMPRQPPPRGHAHEAAE